MKDNEYARKEKPCPLIGDYCNERHKDCNRCIAEEDACQRLQCYIDRNNYDWTFNRIKHDYQKYYLKGGCLELHQKAGGKYQDWKYVTPRHDAFIDKLATSPIHIVATMRGKDQYDMEKDDKGKTTVKKLGVGAKQRDGFEFEFTCTFTIDSKSHTAETQKDNTHIFENDVAVVLTENHGKKIMQWANASDIEPVVPEASATQSEYANTEDLASVKKEIISICVTLGGQKNEELMSTLKDYAPSGNPNAIKSMEKARECLEKIKVIKPIA